MAVTQLSDIIVPDVFARYVMEMSNELNTFLRSGIMQVDPRLQNFMNQNYGSVLDMPFWQDLDRTNESNVGSDDPTSSITPENLAAVKDIARRHFRNKAYGAADILASVAGDDPMQIIASRYANYWDLEIQDMLVSSLLGVKADNIAADSGDMVYSIATDPATVTDAERISADAISRALNTLGDMENKIVAMAMHSDIYRHLRTLNLVDSFPTNEQNLFIRMYSGIEIIINDKMPVVAGSNQDIYTTVFFSRGAIGWAEGAARNPVEVHREPLQADGHGTESLISRREFMLHPIGIAFDGTPAGESPTNTELAASGNWSRVAERKSVGIAFLDCHA